MLSSLNSPKLFLLKMLSNVSILRLWRNVACNLGVYPCFWTDAPTSFHTVFKADAKAIGAEFIGHYSNFLLGYVSIL